ncbi:substrate-binding periplasmic protein [Bdellovibrio sp. HCB337]|uniref:substrate-binding periplasmic protein n=1 Tax=Bdellovibrio sp. HCB337 TaxID=3394358 RepID=UPI0039A45F01
MAKDPPGTLQVGLSDAAPYGYKEGEQFKGINYDIFTQIEKESGLRFNYTMYPHARLANSMEKTDSDLAIFFSVSCVKHAAYEFKEKLYEVKTGLYLKDQNALKRPGARIGVLLGTCTRLVKTHLTPDMVVELTSMDHAIEMLRVGRLEGVCGIKNVIDFSIQKNKAFHEKLVPAHIDDQPLEAVLCRRKSLSADIKGKIDKALQKIKVPSVK